MSRVCAPGLFKIQGLYNFKPKSENHEDVFRTCSAHIF